MYMNMNILGEGYLLFTRTIVPTYQRISDNQIWTTLGDNLDSSYLSRHVPRREKGRLQDLVYQKLKNPFVRGNVSRNRASRRSHSQALQIDTVLRQRNTEAAHSGKRTSRSPSAYLGPFRSCGFGGWHFVIAQAGCKGRKGLQYMSLTSGLVMVNRNRG